jgi:hypothetical protein
VDKPGAAFIENQQAALSEQKGEDLHFPVTGIAGKKQNDGIKVLSYQRAPMVPAILGFRMDQNLGQHGMAPEAPKNLRAITAENGEARIPEKRALSQVLQPLQYIRRLRGLNDEHALDTSHQNLPAFCGSLPPPSI